MRYIIGLIVGIFIIVLLFIFLIRGIGNFGNNSNKPTTDTPLNLINYADTSTQVRFTTDYPVNADQIHHQVATIVGSSQSSLTVFNGYQGSALRSKTYANNPTAYATFLRALQLAGFTLGNKDTSLKDERGYCPTGRRYIVDIVDGDKTLQRYWTTSCGTSLGTFKGKISTIDSLFRAQIPDYSSLVSGIN